MTLVVLGMLILFLGWFGFNPGSTLAATSLRISVIAVNTFLAGIAGGLAAYYIRFIETGKVDIAATCSGIVGGLVAITAPCAFVESWAAVVIGVIAGPIVVYGARFIETSSSSTTRCGPSPATCIAASGACFRSESSPTGPTAASPA